MWLLWDRYRYWYYWYWYWDWFTDIWNVEFHAKGGWGRALLVTAYDCVPHQSGSCNGCYRTLVSPRSALSQYALRTYACELVLGPMILNSAGFFRQTRSGFDRWMLRRGLPVKEVVWAASFAILIKTYLYNRHYYISVSCCFHGSLRM